MILAKTVFLVIVCAQAHLAACQEQLAAARVLDERGAHVVIDQYHPLGSPAHWTLPDGEHTLYDALTCRVVYLHIPPECGVSASELYAIARLGSLRMLELSRLRVDDARKLRAALQTSRLSVLELTACEGADEIVMSLGDVRALEAVALVDSNVSLAAVEGLLARQPPLTHFALEGQQTLELDFKLLTPYKQLRDLSLRGTALCEDSIPLLGALEGLLAVDLSNCELTPAVFEALRRLPKLESLFLENTAIDDDRVAELSKLRRLEGLALTGCPISDKALEYLAESKTLKMLLVRNTSVTEEGCERLSRSNRVLIERDRERP